MPAPTRSAVIVTVPEAEPVVGPHRDRLDRAAGLGVPAHVTVLYPFAPPGSIDAALTAGLADAVATVPGFLATFAAPGWFGTEVLWLAPEPADRFIALTTSVVAAFPAYPPYGGEFDEVTPHLTVGHDVPADDLRRAETDIVPLLPVHAAIGSVALWCGAETAASWRQVATFPLG